MLSDNLKTLLATEYAFVIKAQFFHWNVEGPDFAQLHKFFGKIYDEVYENSIDQTAGDTTTLEEHLNGFEQQYGKQSKEVIADASYGSE
jgi:DNA-binding ferritin-like protein